MVAEYIGRNRNASAALLAGTAALFLLCSLYFTGSFSLPSSSSVESSTESRPNFYESSDNRRLDVDPVHSRPQRSAKYSGVQESDGIVFSLDRHYAKRRARRSAARPRRARGIRGAARDCGHSCSIKLRSGDSSYIVHLHVWRQLPHPHNHSLPDLANGAVVPVVQYMDGEDSTRASIGRTNFDCIFKARVDGSKDSSILNICDEQGVFGMLALPDGVYSVEPLHDSEGEKSTSARHQDHLVHRFKSHNFRQYDYDKVTPDEATTGGGSIRSAVNVSYEEMQWEDLNKRHTRSRRSANSWDHYVEVFVVADTKMHEYHGRSLESYILTLFSTVASIYRHQSLRAAINIVVVKILILQSEHAGPHVSSNAQDSLQQFCRWQRLYNDMNDDSPNHYDVAILLTRGDICSPSQETGFEGSDSAAGKCDTLGLAELGTMCDLQKSCAIIEDNGLSAAFTIAHELGHIFNIPHDDERKCGEFMALSKTNFHIMAPTLEYNTHPWSWSACSAAMLERFLEQRGQIQCLFDQPIERRYYDEMFDSDSPGRKYDVNQQCKFVFGPHAELCPYMPSCRRLWCSIQYGSQLGCRTQHMPWADGTPCDKNGHMYCHRGDCVGMAPEHRMKIDGAWGEWQPYGSCSRTCGGGVQKGLRDCDKPKPANGGKYCVGMRERHRSCNAHECPWDTPGFREIQCAEFNNKDVGIHGIPKQTIWVPKYAGVAENERCKLYCRAQGSAAFYSLKDKVIDGTPCDRSGDDICVDGTCKPAGCDHVLGSKLRRDKCGVCGGDDTGCKFVKGVYNERGSFGYNEVMKIPAGSAYIDIRQHGRNKDDDNYLSLRTANGEFLLNGNYQVSVFRQQIPIQDVVLEYSGSDNAIERINGTAPIRSDIYLHVLSVGNLHPPDIRYEYMTSVTSSYRPPVPTHFYWRPSDRWTPCSKECQGQEFEESVCIDAMNNRQTSDRNCKMRKPQTKSRMCNIECHNRWQVEEISRCTAHCGRGEKRQKVFCAKVDNMGRTTPTNEQECGTLQRPPDRVSCYTDCTGRRWSYSDWGQCSETCGSGGISRRNFYCIDDANRVLDTSMCDSQAKEVTEKECNRIPCPRWIHGAWSECSRSCDGGVRMRHAQCVDAADREIHPSRCDITKKMDKEKCNEHLCTFWTFGHWSNCSVKCGRGNMTRSATCVDKSGRQLDDGRCDVRQRIVSKECHKPACPSWKLGEWSACTQSCNDGWQQRRVSCVDSHGREIQRKDCLDQGLVLPSTHKQCSNGPCPFWRIGEWSACSVPCGSGLRTRTIACVHQDQVVDNSFCGTFLPNTTQSCRLPECTVWETSSWSVCSASCGNGTQTRTVHCVKDSSKAKTADHDCNRKDKPQSVRPCHRDSCARIATPNVIQQPPPEVPTIYWATGTWTECSQTCGMGTQRRQVKCHDHVRELPDKYCEHIDKVESEQQCMLRPCARWDVGQWKPCSASCGEFVQQERRVSCIASDGVSRVSEGDCDVAQRPIRTRSCNLPPCVRGGPSAGFWVTQPWSKCPVSCGGGWKTRGVVCSTQQCDARQKPVDAERCNEQPCPKNIFTWQRSPWTSCSVTCGGGIQRRRVWCDDPNLKRVDDSECKDAKPTETRDCSLPPCPRPPPSSDNNTRWSAGPWSACSAKCGRGTRKRNIYCLEGANTMVATTRCKNETRPIDTHRCRETHCPRWRPEAWGECSASCGEGVRRRAVVCQRGRKTKVSEAECAHKVKPMETSKCVNLACPRYHWTSSPWSKCVDPCSKSEQHRRVYCMNQHEEPAAPRMCANKSMPIASRECSNDLCPYEWVPGPWNTCTKTCGNGTQHRTIECRVKSSFVSTFIDMSSFKLLSRPKQSFEPSVPKQKCAAFEPPVTHQMCMMNACEAPFRWQAGPWGECSTTCGDGIRRRKVRCFSANGTRVEKSHCEHLIARPRRSQSCMQRNCLPNTCQEIKAQNAYTHSIDGDYTVLLDGFAVKIYCARMNETIPRSYINVSPETNYADIYGKRLVYPHTCPYNGERNESCHCTDDGAAHAGHTIFTKVRIDLGNRKLLPHDFTFSTTPYGHKVNYASAGDCYSMKDCPQGKFSVDLRGTGLKIIDDLQWEDRGLRTISRIERTHGNALIEGRCGGYCGKCVPDRYKGLMIEIDRNQLPMAKTGEN